MINLGLKTEYSFRQCYGFVKDIHKQGDVIGIADLNNTYAFVELEKQSIKHKFKPIYGVRLTVSKSYAREKHAQLGPVYIFIAKNIEGLKEIYSLVTKAWDNYYYSPRINFNDMCNVSSNVIVIAESFCVMNDQRVDYLALTTTTPIKSLKSNKPRVYIQNNYFNNIDDFGTYELLAGRDSINQTYPLHVLTEKEFNYLWGVDEALVNTKVIADSCDHIKLPKASMVKFSRQLDIDTLCKEGARNKSIDLNSDVYKHRYERELELIKQKGYVDYFLIVADMISKAKTKMLVGPSRGSSAGSLVAYLLSITEINPIEYGLLFERFIDINRIDSPDIDVDFPDNKRSLVIKDLISTYGDENVKQLSNINTIQPRTAISEFAKGLKIPKYETEDIKDGITNVFTGDSIAGHLMDNAFNNTEIGKEFIAKYPAMKNAASVEGHAYHSGTHAAGIVVTNDHITNFCGVNSRDGNAMLDKHTADYLNLLKIDCLGLRTLTILEETANLAGFDCHDYYKLPVNDDKVFNIFNQYRFSGVFQFVGQALQQIVRQMGIHSFDDIVATTALARPGPLVSGGTKMFTDRKTGQTPVVYLSSSEDFIKHTKETLGIIIYQEQLMSVAKDYGDLTWEEVSQIRKAASKSLGQDFFNQYKESFLKGTSKKGIPENEALDVWNNMVTFGAWGFNKSHAVSYALISYWTAWAKTYYPLEFACANLNNTSDDETALLLLRDMVESDGIEYLTIDPDNSDLNWTIHNGKLLCGLTKIKGIGIQKAKSILKSRKENKPYTPAMFKHLLNPKTSFDVLYECKHYWGDLYDNPRKYSIPLRPFFIKDINDEGEYIFIGKLKEKKLKDLNDQQSVDRRNGEVYEDDHLIIHMILQDDTGDIKCTVNRYRYKLLGENIFRYGAIDKDWYIVRGKIRNEYRSIDIEDINNLNNTYNWMIEK